MNWTRIYSGKRIDTPAESVPEAVRADYDKAAPGLVFARPVPVKRLFDGDRPLGRGWMLAQACPGDGWEVTP